MLAHAGQLMLSLSDRIKAFSLQSAQLSDWLRPSKVPS